MSVPSARSGVTPEDFRIIMREKLRMLTDKNAPPAKLMQRVAEGGTLTPQEAIYLRRYLEAGGMAVPIEAINAVTAQRSSQDPKGGVSMDTDNGIGGGGPEGNAATLAQRIQAAARQAAAGAAQTQGGVSSGMDNGIGGGGPEGNAALAAIAQQQTLPAGAGTQAPGAGGGGSTPPSTNSGSTLPGGYSAAQGDVLSQDDEQLLRFAMQAAGLNPDRLTRFSKIAGRALAPLIQARRGAFGLMGGQANVGGLPQDIADFAREYTTGGRDFFGNAQRYAQGVLGSDTFKSAVAGLQQDEQRQAMYQSLMPLLFAGANPLVQQSAADTFNRQTGLFNDADFNRLRDPNAPAPGGGIFTDWLRGQPNLDPITRRIFGL